MDAQAGLRVYCSHTIKETRPTHCLDKFKKVAFFFNLSYQLFELKKKSVGEGDIKEIDFDIKIEELS